MALKKSQMTKIVLILYNLFFVPLLYIGVQIAGLFNAKIKSGLAGRRGLYERMSQQLAEFSNDGPRLWMHCSSAGEYEQGRPIIMGFRERYPDGLVVLSFFSPSGYDHVKVPDGVIKVYLPIDSFWQSKKFVEIVNPNIACVIRHDIWPNFQFHLKKRNVPSFLVDASLSDDNFKFYKMFKFFVGILYSGFEEILSVSDEHNKRLEAILPRKTVLRVIGDTRYDQVYIRTRELAKIRLLIDSNYFLLEKTLIVGSSWPSDEKHLLPALLQIIRENPEFKAIIVPHEVTKENLDKIISFFADNDVNLARYTELKVGEKWDFKVLLVDTFGLLANLYVLGKMAYVGGGFGLGVNSVLEPAAHGCGVIFGPRHLNVVEAKMLIGFGGAASIKDTNNIYSELNDYLHNPEENEKRGARAKEMVGRNLGASRRALDIMTKFIKVRGV